MRRAERRKRNARAPTSVGGRVPEAKNRASRDPAGTVQRRGITDTSHLVPTLRRQGEETGVRAASPGGPPGPVDRPNAGATRPASVGCRGCFVRVPGRRRGSTLRACRPTGGRARDGNPSSSTRSASPSRSGGRSPLERTGVSSPSPCSAARRYSVLSRFLRPQGVEDDGSHRPHHDHRCGGSCPGGPLGLAGTGAPAGRGVGGRSRCAGLWSARTCSSRRRRATSSFAGGVSCPTPRCRAGPP